MLSKACQHGLKAMICITNNSTKNKRVSIGEISSKIDTPEAYTSKILQKLVKAGFVQSKKGATGGFYIEDSLITKLTLWDIVSELDGGSLKYSCILGLDECSNKNPCPAHAQYKAVRDKLIWFLENNFLIDMAKKIDLGKGTLVVNLNSIKNNKNEKVS